MAPSVDTPLHGLQGEQLRAFIEAFQRAGRTMESQIEGDSMGASLPQGARIRIEAVPPEDLQLGQIVACVQYGVLFAHRLVGHHGGFLMTQGDGWILCDLPVPASALLGRVTAYWDGTMWRPPADSPARSPGDQKHAEFHVRLVMRCLRLNPVFARMVARRMLTVYTGKEMVRKWWGRTASAT